MKKNSSISALFGVTQLDMAMILGIGSSHWSMYESGKRDLPLRANQLLAEMLKHINSPEKADKSVYTATQSAIQRKIARLRQKNEYEQHLLARKIAAVRKKQATEARLIKLADFLNMLQKKSSTPPNVFHQHIRYKATQIIPEKHASMIAEYEIKQEVLELERLLLESKMRKISL